MNTKNLLVIIRTRTAIRRRRCRPRRRRSDISNFTAVTIVSVLLLSLTAITTTSAWITTMVSTTSPYRHRHVQHVLSSRRHDDPIHHQRRITIMYPPLMKKPIQTSTITSAIRTKSSSQEEHRVDSIIVGEEEEEEEEEDITAQQTQIRDQDTPISLSSSSSPSSSSTTPSSSATLLQTLLNLDPEWKETFVDFIDPINPDRSIPCHIALMIPWDGVPFYIGTPIHTTMAVLCESSSSSSDSSSYFIDPDKEENLEIMERAVAEFYKAFADDDISTDTATANDKENGKENTKIMQKIKFQRCPRALTVVEGDLTRLTGFTPTLFSSSTKTSSSSSSLIDTSLQEILLNKGDENVSNQEEVDDDEKYLDSFFRQELGDDYMQSLIDIHHDGTENQQLQEQQLDDDEFIEWKDLFNLPFLGKKSNNYHPEKKQEDELIVDDEVLLLKELLMEKDVFLNEYNHMPQLMNQKEETTETAIRLVRFQGPDGHYYTLTQLIQPMILVAKKVEKEKYSLLTPVEEEILIPKLEMILQQEFAKIMQKI